MTDDDAPADGPEAAIRAIEKMQHDLNAWASKHLGPEFRPQKWWTLDAQNNVVEAPSLLAWVDWMATVGDPRRWVAQTVFSDCTLVSTVFLHADQRLMGEGPPIMFETMVFRGDKQRGDFERHLTWAEAEAGHWAMVKRYAEQAGPTVTIVKGASN